MKALKVAMKTMLTEGEVSTSIYLTFKLIKHKKNATNDLQVTNPKMPRLGKIKQGPFFRNRVMPNTVM